MLGLAVAAFFPMYFGRFPSFEWVSASAHFHVATMVGWLALTIAQPVLILRGHRRAHRRLGRLTYLYLPFVAAGFWLMMLDGQLRVKNPDLILATAFDGSMFFLMVGLGIAHRKQRAHHSRYMMLSLVPFINPTLGRLIAPQVSLPIELALLVALLVQAHRKRELTRPFAVALIALLSLLVVLVVVMLALPTAAEWLWQRIVA